MEMGCAAVMANTAIATANDIRAMARAFSQAVIAGRSAYLAGLGRVKGIAEASSPLTGLSKALKSSRLLLSLLIAFKTSSLEKLSKSLSCHSFKIPSIMLWSMIS